MKRALLWGLLVTLLGLLTVLPGAAMPAREPVGLVASANGVQTTWQLSTVDSTGTVGLYPDVAVDSAGRPHVAYYDDTDDNLKYAYYNGSSWTIQTVDSAGTVGQYPSIAINSVGRPCIAYWGDGNIKYACKTGSSWTVEVAGPGGWTGHQNSLALDSLDRPHIAAYNTDSGGLRYIYKDSSWHTVDVETGSTGMYPAIDLDSAGHPGITYCAYDANWQCTTLKYAHHNGSSWSIEAVESGHVGFYTSLAFDSADQPHVSYYENSLWDLRYAYRNGSTWNIQTVDSAGVAGSYTSLQLANGLPRISYYDELNYDLKFASYDGSAWALETVDSAGSVGLYTGLALGPDGQPHIAYYDSTNGDLKYASGACTPVTGVTIGGPRYLTVGETGSYSASPYPSSASGPVQYTWDDGNSGATNTYSWGTPGRYTIAVEGANACGSGQGSLTVLVTAQPSVFGINQYLTNSYHDDNDINTIIPLSQAAGPRWSREEIIWANYDTDWGPAFFDQRILQEYLAGFHIIGDIATTPAEYSSQACRDWATANGYAWWFCPPTNAADFAAFCSEVTERYDGDGYLDAAGSPRIPVWEVWNEPDAVGTFLPAPDPAHYTQMLCQCSAAIKAADPTAKVLIGGVAGFDTVGRDGFLDAVVNNGGLSCFDVLSYHVYESPYSPEYPGPNWSMAAIMQTVSDWVNAHGGNKEMWMTEVGWSTYPTHLTQDLQASYIVRAHGLIFYHGWQQIDYFQMHDHGGGMGSPYAEMSLVEPDYTLKQSYTAYSVMTRLLGDAQYVDPGPLNNVSNSWSDVYDLRFSRPNGNRIDLLWQLDGQTTYSYPVEPGVQWVVLYDRDGTFQVLTPVGGSVNVTLSGRPCYLERWYAVTHVYLPLIQK